MCVGGGRNYLLCPTGSRWALWWPELIFSLQESRFEPFFSHRERHFRCPRGALLSSGAEIPVGAQFLLRGTCRGPQSSDYSREPLADLRPRATVRARATVRGHSHCGPRNLSNVGRGDIQSFPAPSCCALLSRYSDTATSRGAAAKHLSPPFLYPCC